MTKSKSKSTKKPADKTKQSKPKAQHLVQEKTAEFTITTPEASAKNAVKTEKKFELVDIEEQPGRLEPVAPGALTPMELVSIAVQQNADVDKIDKLMQLQERWEKKEAEKAFVAAMAGFKSEHLTIMKGKHVKYKNNDGSITEYDHATLDNICEIVAPVLSKYNLSHRWVTDQLDKETVKVTCFVTHSLGHSESVSLAAGPDKTGGKNAIQAVGSTASYLERYTLLAILGIAVKDQDDDGRSVTESDDGGMPKKEIDNFEKRLNGAKTIESLQNISKQATAAANKYKDEPAYDHLKNVYVAKKAALGNG